MNPDPRKGEPLPVYAIIQQVKSFIVTAAVLLFSVIGVLSLLLVLGAAFAEQTSAAWLLIGLGIGALALAAVAARSPHSRIKLTRRD